MMEMRDLFSLHNLPQALRGVKTYDSEFQFKQAVDLPVKSSGK